jgi:hypothetical protein
MLDNYDYEEHNVSLWVSEDGSFGSGNIVFINTDDWTKDDYNSLDDASDSDKYPLAIGITKMREAEAHPDNSFTDLYFPNTKFPDVRVFIINDDGVTEIGENK